MTKSDFYKRVRKDNRLDIYLYYFNYIFLTTLLLYSIYDAISNPAKYDQFGTRIFAIVMCSALVFLGLRGIMLIPNRYKVMELESALSNSEKNKSVLELSEYLGECSIEIIDGMYCLNCIRGIWEHNYTIYISYNNYAFFVSIQSSSWGSGIIDFGSSERFRKKVYLLLQEVSANKLLPLT